MRCDMIRSVRLAAGLIVPALAVLVTPPPVSDPLGAYCLVDKVVMEPNDCPDRVQIWGACAVANPRNGQFQPAAKGYFYFSIVKGKEDTARGEWMDIAKAAGSRQ